jgi:hypothetical protein
MSMGMARASGVVASALPYYFTELDDDAGLTDVAVVSHHARPVRGQISIVRIL